MTNKPHIFFDVHVLLTVKSAALNNISELDMRPKLAMSADPHVVIQV